MNVVFKLTLIGLMMVTPACLDPLVDDTIVRPDLILAAGSSVPLLAADPVALASVSDNITPAARGLITVRRAFCNGAAVDWWDLGPASRTPVAGYLLVEADAAGELHADGRTFKRIDHPMVLSAVPGDLGYSPLVRLVLVPVTPKYEGEILTSIDALDAAEREGLVEGQFKIPYALNSPVVLPTSRLEPAPGATPIEPETAYFKGRSVHVFTFGTVFSPGSHLPVSTQFGLRREGGEPISEVLRLVDITGDGDANDTNDLFLHAPGQVGYSPLVRVIDVVVPADTMGIDSYADSDESDIMSAADLFAEDGVTPDGAVVRGLYPSDSVLNRPFATRSSTPAVP